MGLGIGLEESTSAVGVDLGDKADQYCQSADGGAVFGTCATSIRCWIRLVKGFD